MTVEELREVLSHYSSETKVRFSIVYDSREAEVHEIWPDREAGVMHIELMQKEPYE